MSNPVSFETCFDDPGCFGEPFISEADVLRIFRNHNHMHVRNACLHALKRAMGEGSKDEGGGFGNDSTDFVLRAELFESTIEGLSGYPGTRPIGSRARSHQMEWYKGARETLIDAYLYTSSRYNRNAYDLSRALSFLVRMQLSSQPLMSNTKSVKHISYYYGHKALFLRQGESVDIHLLEDFLFKVLNGFSDVVAGTEVVHPDSWGSIKTIIRFMFDIKYFPEKLLVLLDQLRQLFEIRLRTESFDASRFEHVESMAQYHSAILLLKSVVKVGYSKVK